MRDRRSHLANSGLSTVRTSRFQGRGYAFREALLWCAALLLSLYVTSFWPAVAQEPISPSGEQNVADLHIQQLRIQLMPEFDDPRVLIIVQGRLSIPDTALPLPVTVRVPRGAQINQMAAIDLSSGATIPQPFEARPDPDDPRWTLVTYTLDSAHFFYEYYYNPLVGKTDKQFSFTLSSPQAVADLSLEVQEPLAATNFALNPSPTSTRFDEAFGFTYHQFDLGALATGEERSVTVSYTKADPAPSVSREELMAAQRRSSRPEVSPVAKTSQGSDATPIWVFVLLGGVVLAPIGGFIWYRARSGGNHLHARSCLECGTTLKADGYFCHACGAFCSPGDDAL